MKTIVLATDFSANATNAARYAVRLARDWQATLVLLHAYHYPPENPIKAGDFPLSVRSIREQSEKAMKQLGADLHAYAGGPVSIQYVLKEGFTLPSIQQTIRNMQADLLIMSTVGTAPQSAQLFGSIATDMIPLTSVPLLLIPPGVTYAPVKNIVLGVDLDTPPDVIAFDAAIRLVGGLGAVVNILCINDRPEAPAIRERALNIRHLLRDVPHTLTIQAGDEIFDALLGFAQASKADLIMMLPQVHGWFARLFSEGNTQRVARLTDIPLLAVA
ncbi:universal stress protein [Fibrisoma montanum]|uniref:Universal stress protein n=1 Tax=Fibrisoma montanum TaxID=2305895 RepID=A0A418M732_9BACT|nr:universal stress protein [Fibrisoma montanum]RIV21565.1 universal stress protein [Fibrisoma montanum]